MSMPGKDGLPCWISCTGVSIHIQGEPPKPMWAEADPGGDGVLLQANPPFTLMVWNERRGRR